MRILAIEATTIMFCKLLVLNNKYTINKQYSIRLIKYIKYFIAKTKLVHKY